MALTDEQKVMRNSTGMRIADALEHIASNINDTYVYGFIEDMSVLDPEDRITYFGEAAAFDPMTRNQDGTMSEGGWGTFIDKLDNHPWMVRWDGTPDYRLMDDDYTKKMDGTASDVANQNYAGGAFAWIKRIYKQEKMVGSKRIVGFRFTKADGYEPIGFIDPSGNVLEGVWIPMFYGSIDSNGKMRSLSGMQPCYSKTTAQEHDAIVACGNRHVFYGGGIAKTIEDLEIMLGKSSNIQEVFGRGNCSGYDASLSPTNGVKANAVVGGGRFYGTDTGTALNKAFHSIVLASFQQYMRDPYWLLVDGEYKVSPNYVYDVTGATYTATGVTIPASGGWFYPHFYQTIPHYGSVPVYEDTGYKGSTTTGGCDGAYFNISGVRVALRFGDCNNGLLPGPRCVALDREAGFAYWSIGAASLLLPPVGVAA